MTQGSAPLGRYFPGSRRRPIQHGTIGGYRAHYRYGEPMCEPCRHANRLTKGWRGPQRQGQCGTAGGYNRHHRRGEQACSACKAAVAEARDRREMRKRGDVWPYEHLVPAVADLTSRGYSVAEVATALGVSRLRVARARARAGRAA